MPLKEKLKEEALMLEEEAEKLLDRLHVHRPLDFHKILLGILGLIVVVWFLLWLTGPGECMPAPEVCDGLDNDCDGVVDNDLTQECGVSDVGECSFGITTCKNGKWLGCSGGIGPAPDICDGLDNDCDGIIDNIPAQECYYGPEGTLGVGMCTAGFIGCSNGQITGCEGMIMPHFEDCDGRDNDCDGEVDEDVKRVCYSGPDGTRNVGECTSGFQHCVNNVYGVCTGEVLPAAEVCDEKDNDCDGAVDEGC